MTLPAEVKKIIVDYYCIHKSIRRIALLAGKNSLFRRKLLSFYEIWYIHDLSERIEICEKYKIKGEFLGRLKKFKNRLANYIVDYAFKFNYSSDISIGRYLSKLSKKQITKIIQLMPELLYMEAYYDNAREQCLFLELIYYNTNTKIIVYLIKMGLNKGGIVNDNDKYINILDPDNIKKIYSGSSSFHINEMMQKIVDINNQLKN